jgi:hypothetical protein
MTEEGGTDPSLPRRTDVTYLRDVCLKLLPYNLEVLFTLKIQIDFQLDLTLSFLARKQ